MELSWSSHFTKAFKRTISADSGKKEKLVRALNDLGENPFAPGLRTHKLKGELKNCWACYVEYDIRIVFAIVKNDAGKNERILLLNIGSHDEVY